jgi:signal transduction histidine kinase
LGGALVEAFAALPEADRGAVRLAVDDRARDVRLCAFRAVTVRVLAEILANAAEAIRRGGRADGRITVEAGPASERDAPAGTTRAPGAAPSPAGAGPRFVSVRVADDGEGLSAEARDRLFEPGFTTRPRPGPGPGLHWCANAIALMGGSIRAESEGPGRGATVVIVLPAGNGAAEGG